MIKQSVNQKSASVKFRPPIVTILGHVDHGKTTLLDYIRKTNVAGREHGGITQHIGAYQVMVNPKGEPSSRASQASRGILRPDKIRVQDDRVLKKHTITFVDTPGHEAFAKMRSRGADVADLAVLVVAGNDGVMPQTVESVNYIKSANIPWIVAVNKIDLPDINLDRIKKQLMKLGFELEEYGGEIPLVPLSAKTGQGVNKLLEMILLLAELKEVKEDLPDKTKAVVIESTLTKNRGTTATVIIRSGTLSVGDDIVCENQAFRIRAIINWLGENVKNASAGDPVEILGWQSIPTVGSIIFKVHEVELSKQPQRPLTSVSPKRSLSLSPQVLPLVEEKIRIILKTDTYGTLEAIMNILKDKDSVNVINSGVGTISESDIFLAKTTKSLVMGFQIKPINQVLKLAETEKVIIKTYNIIYELLNEIDEVIEAIRTGNMVSILGEAKIIALFPIKDQTIAGVKVISGRIARGDQVKIMRNDQEISRAKIKSLKHGKEDITTSAQGTEAGLLLSHKVDFLTGDSIISIG